MVSLMLLKFEIQSCHVGCYFFKYILSEIEIFNESNISSLIRDLCEVNKTLKASHRLYRYTISIDVLKMISRIPELLIFMIENGMNLYFNRDIDFFRKYFFETDNLDLTRKLFNWKKFDNFCLRRFYSRDYMTKFEIVSESTVGEYFLKWENSEDTKTAFAQGFAKFLYFEWRSVLAFWIKGPNRESIRLIQNPIIIELLRMDFPNETAELLGPDEAFYMTNAAAVTELENK